MLIKPLSVFVGIFLAVIMVSCTENDTSKPAAGSINRDIIQKFISTYNEGNVAEIAKFWHEDIVWFEVSGDDAIAITRTAEQLSAEMRTYFEHRQNSRSSAHNIAVNGNFVSFIETSSNIANEEQSISSTAVYELEDGLIRRAWYFPAQNR